MADDDLTAEEQLRAALRRFVTEQAECDDDGPDGTFECRWCRAEELLDVMERAVRG